MEILGCDIEDGEDVQFFDEELYACAAAVAYSCGLWSLPLFFFHESRLVF
jgi:hypothetical protein